MKRILFTLIVVVMFSFAVYAQENQVGVGALYTSEDAQQRQQSAGGFVYVVKNFDVKGQKFTALNDFMMLRDGVDPEPKGRIISNDLRVRYALEGLSWDFGTDQNTAQVYATALFNVKNQNGQTQFSPGAGVGFAFNDKSFVEYHYIPATSGAQWQGHRFTAERYQYLNSTQNYYTKFGVTGYIANFNPNPNVKQDLAGAIFFIGFGKRIN